MVADVSNSINENTNENNNISKVDSFYVQAPDLTVPSVMTSARDTTGDTTIVRYLVVNRGPGVSPAKWAADRIYISRLDTFNLDSATVLKSQSYATTIQADDTVTRSSIVTIPDGFDGRRYFYVYTDVANNIFEGSNEGNNTGRSDSV